MLRRKVGRAGIGGLKPTLLAAPAELAEQSDGVRIFIGAESAVFGTSGVSMIVAPARNAADRIVGAIGVMGPTRINYGRIIPVVDYTARVIGRLLGYGVVTLH